MKNSIEFNDKVNQILTSNGLDWEVLKRPNVTSMERQIVDHNGQLKTEEYFIPSDSVSIRHGETLKELYNGKKGYTICQNREMVELILKGAEPFGSQISVSNGGALDGGKKVFLQLAIEGHSKVGDDIVKSFLTYIDSNDGSTSCGLGFGNKTMSCANQFHAFSKNGRSKFRHTVSLTNRIQEIPMLIENALSESMRTIAQYQAMVGVKVDNRMKNALVKHLIGVCNTSPIADLSNASTRVINSMEELYSMIDIEMAQKGKNLWGLHSGTTRWTTHSKSAPRRDFGRLESSMVGTNSRTNHKSFDFALDLL